MQAWGKDLEETMVSVCFEQYFKNYLFDKQSDRDR